MLAEIGVSSLSIFPELGLVLFLGVFVSVAVRAMRRPRSEMSRCADLPLHDAAVAQGDPYDNETITELRGAAR